MVAAAAAAAGILDERQGTGAAGPWHTVAVAGILCDTGPWVAAAGTAAGTAA